MEEKGENTFFILCDLCGKMFNSDDCVKIESVDVR